MATANRAVTSRTSPTWSRRTWRRPTSMPSTCRAGRSTSRVAMNTRCSNCSATSATSSASNPTRITRRRDRATSAIRGLTSLPRTAISAGRPPRTSTPDWYRRSSTSPAERVPRDRVTGGTRMDPVDLFERGSAWTAAKIPGAIENLDNSTPCDKWTVEDVLNHMLDTQRYFTGVARGESPELPSPTPPSLLDDDPVAQYEAARQATIAAFRAPGVLEKTGPSLGIAFVDQLVHGWDLAEATGQDTTMPAELAEPAFSMLDGRLTDERRGDAFKPAVPVADDASPHDRLLAYVGREPSRAAT